MAKKSQSEWMKELSLVETTVDRIEYQNELVNDKYKTVFYCPSYEKPEGRMCIAWGKTNFKAGDKLTMKGRFQDGVFLAWSHTFTAQPRPRHPLALEGADKSALTNGVNPSLKDIAQT